MKRKKIIYIVIVDLQTIDTIEIFFFSASFSSVLFYIYVKCNLSLKRFTNEEIKVLCRLKA